MQPQHGEDPSRGIKIGLLAVIGLMSWPVWAAVIAGMQSFNYAAWASALVPLAICMMPIALWLHVPERVGHGRERVEHALHVDGLTHHDHQG